ncbi:MAG: thiamine pyrophosphate-dependent dehydrogenase E1 component subunit alpha [bacterium]
MAELSERGKIPGNIHSYVGQEAIAVGILADLSPQDYMASTHRGHGHLIAKGGDLKRMMAELYGKATGYCKGKGGSMHVADFSIGSLGANGIVGGGIAMATGAALANKLDGSNAVTVAFFGDGASNQGVVYECFNMASIWQLPIIYVLENNQYAVTTSAKEAVGGDITARGLSYGIETKVVDGNDVIEVYKTACSVLERVRRGEGPCLLVCNTYRIQGHLVGEWALNWRYRSQEEVDSWKKRCPIDRLRGLLEGELGVPAAELNRIDGEVEQLVAAAVEFAENSPYPAESEAETDVLV